MLTKAFVSEVSDRIEHEVGRRHLEVLLRQVAIGAAVLGVEGDSVLHPERGIARAHGVVFVRERRAKDGHDRVAVVRLGHDGLVHLGHDRARHDRVDPDPGPGVLDRRLPGQGVDAARLDEGVDRQRALVFPSIAWIDAMLAAMMIVARGQSNPSLGLTLPWVVAVLAPPQTEPGAADALWSNLAGLLGQRRRLDPRPHVSFELHWTTQGLTVGLWVPGTVAPHLVERAVEAAWPGARLL